MGDGLIFKRGDSVEVCSSEEGFKGSYYKATIISALGEKTYTVKYETLLNEDESGPLIELVPINEVRPLPPTLTLSSEFSVGHKVDAFDNDGWWVGYITAKNKEEDMFSVYFPDYNSEFLYHSDSLRFHLEWISGLKWVHSGLKDACLFV